MKPSRAERWQRRLRLVGIALIVVSVSLAVITWRYGTRLPHVQRMMLYSGVPLTLKPSTIASENRRMSMEFPWDFRINNGRYVTAGEFIKPGKMNLLIIDQMNVGGIYDVNMNEVSKSFTFPTTISSHPYSAMWQWNPIVARMDRRDYLLRYAGGTVEMIDLRAGDNVWETRIPSFGNTLQGQFKLVDGPDGAKTVLAYSRDAGLVAFIDARFGALLREVEVVADTTILPAQFDDDEFMEVLFVASGGDFHLYEHDGTFIREGRFENENGHPTVVMPVKLSNGEHGVRIGNDHATLYAIDGRKVSITKTPPLPQAINGRMPLNSLTSPDGSVLTSGHQFIVWLDANGNEIDRIASSAHTFMLISCDWEKGEAVTAVMDQYNSFGIVGLLKLRK